MISYEKACEIANQIKKENFPDFDCVGVTDIKDRWVFEFSIFSPEEEQYMTPAPMFFVFKGDGEVEWFSIPPLENLYLIQSGNKIDFKAP